MFMLAGFSVHAIAGILILANPMVRRVTVKLEPGCQERNGSECEESDVSVVCLGFNPAEKQHKATSVGGAVQRYSRCTAPV